VIGIHQDQQTGVGIAEPKADDLGEGVRP
jgi:hypothetical protein